MVEQKEEYVLRTVEERGIRFIRLWFTDVLGFLKSFAITPAELETAFEEGMQFDGSAIEAGKFRSPLESAIRAIYGSDMSGDFFGLQFDGSTDARRRGDFASVDRDVLTRNLQIRGDSVQEILASRDGTSGLVYGLLVATTQALGNVNQALGLSGTFVDTFV